MLNPHRSIDVVKKTDRWGLFSPLFLKFLDISTNWRYVVLMILSSEQCPRY